MPGILIVDDMPVIRAGILRVLEQNAIGFSPVLEAADGQEAVDLARRHQPDLILMDIKMPNLTGLQATAQIKAELPGVKVVMLTAHNEFSYVQKALKLGARDYLLKPVRSARLVELLQEITREIKQERTEQRTIEIVKGSLRKTLPVIETSLVDNLVRGTSPESASMEEALGFLGKRLENPAVIVCRVDYFDTVAQGKTPAELQQLYADLVETVRAELPEQQRSLVGYNNPGRVVAVVSCDASRTSYEALLALGEQFRSAVCRSFPFTVTVGVGNAYKDWMSVPLSYAEANLARRYQHVYNRNTVIHIRDVQALDEQSRGARPYRVQLEQELVRAVRDNQQARAAEVINEIVDFLSGSVGDSIDVLRNNCAEVITLVSWAVIGAGTDERTALEVLHNQVHNLPSWKTAAELRAWMTNSLAELMAIVPSRSRNADVIQRAVAYLQTHYQKSDISLQDVASAVNLSPSYLGSLFKTALGVSYVKYLTQLRIDEAKRLLRTTDSSITVVAEQVGYPNVTNFYRHFQRQTNLTPAAFRQSATAPAAPREA